MRTPVQVSFRGMDSSEVVERACRLEALKLERYFDGITSCRIVVTRPNRRHRKGNLHHVRIRLAVPGHEIVVEREPPERHTHEKIALALREAFDAARRELEDYVRRMRQQVKSHEPSPRGRVARVAALEDHGFLESADGREIYFHRNAVEGGAFETLAAGDAVRYREEQGHDGPQATFVRPLATRRGMSSPALSSRRRP